MQTFAPLKVAATPRASRTVRPGVPCEGQRRVLPLPRESVNFHRGTDRRHAVLPISRGDRVATCCCQGLGPLEPEADELTLGRQERRFRKHMRLGGCDGRQKGTSQGWRCVNETSVVVNKKNTDGGRKCGRAGFDRRCGQEGECVGGCIKPATCPCRASCQTLGPRRVRRRRRRPGRTRK